METISLSRESRRDSLDLGFRIWEILDFRLWILDLEIWDLGYRIWDFVSILDFGLLILDLGFGISDLGFCFDFGFWIVDFRFGILDKDWPKNKNLFKSKKIVCHSRKPAHLYFKIGNNRRAGASGNPRIELKDYIDRIKEENET